MTCHEKSERPLSSEELLAAAERAQERELEARFPEAAKLRGSRELGAPLERSELLARVRRSLPLPVGLAGSPLEAELEAEVAAERERLAAYAAKLARGAARAEEAERLYADRLGRLGEGAPAWYLEERELPGGGLSAELLEEALTRLREGSRSGPGLTGVYGWSDGEPYLWRGRLGCLVLSSGGLEGEPGNWSRALLFMSEQEAAAYLEGLRALDVELYAAELEEAAPTGLASFAQQAAEKALAWL